MSIESARALIDRIHVDEEFASRLRACPNAQARMAFVKSAGLDFTAEELKGLEQELTNDELGSITAGLMDQGATDREIAELKERVRRAELKRFDPLGIFHFNGH